MKWFGLLLLAGLAGCSGLDASADRKRDHEEKGSPAMTDDNQGPIDPDDRVVKSDEEWRKQLTHQQYEITRGKDTEPPGTGEYLYNKQDGIYRCVCCGLPLFDADTKYDSKSGWPSFYQPVDEDHIASAADDGLPWEARTEVKCQRCDAHLGHVFRDGPQPTGLRYCINSAALNFEEED